MGMEVGMNHWLEFSSEDAEVILKFRLSVNPRVESLLWHCDKNGLLTVKNAYRLALSTMEQPSCSIGPLGWWKRLWSLRLPSKVRIFCWKACRGILPTRH